MDVIVLIFLIIEIGKLAKRKGLSALRWRVNLAIAWIAGELIGLFFGIVFFGRDNTVSWALLAFGCALSTYLLIKSFIAKLPDVVDEEDVNNIGREQ